MVLFDTKKNPKTNRKNYEITESKVYCINKLDLEYNQITQLSEKNTISESNKENI